MEEISRKDSIQAVERLLLTIHGQVYNEKDHQVNITIKPMKFSN